MVGSYGPDDAGGHAARAASGSAQRVGGELGVPQVLEELLDDVQREPGVGVVDEVLARLVRGNRWLVVIQV